MTSYAHDDVEQLIGGLGNRVARAADFDVYLSEDRLTYVTRNCGQVDLAAKFFLRVFPVHRDDLPEDSKQHGFDNLKFRFHEFNGVTDGDVCMVTRELPKYAIAMIRTGQFTGEGQVWEVVFRPGTSHYIAHLLEELVDVEQLIEGLGYFDVYLSEDRLAYVTEDCDQVDLAAKFVLHVIPVHWDDLPEHRKQHGFDNFDFSFYTDGVTDGEVCAVTQELPKYAIAMIRTGQFTDEGRVWEVYLSLSSAEFDMSNIQSITFQETPNLYFISFDALAPRALLRNYLGIENTRFHDLFDDKFRRFPNFFVNAVRTFQSINMLMSLDEDVFFNTKGSMNAHLSSMFSGALPSPLLRILSENGYETSALYNDTFFGYPKGPHIDNYFINLVDTTSGITHGGEFLLDKLTKLGGDRPQFLIAHLLMPGHTSPYFRYDDQDHLDQFKSFYTRESNSAARYLEDIVAHLKHHDPNAILLVYGDHGPLVSQGMGFDEAPEMVVQDRFGVLGGVYPRDRCSTYFDTAEEQGYLTVLDAVHAILGCLSGGQSVLVRPRENRLGGFGGVPLNSGYTYEDFLYE